MGDGQYTIQDYLEEGQFWEEPHLAVPILENRILKDRLAFSLGQQHRLSFPTLEEIQAKGLETGWPIHFVILSSFYRDIAYDPRVMESYPGLADYRRFYEDLQREGRLVYRVSPAREGQSIPFHPENIYAPTVYLNRFERPGPTIEIWEIDR